MERTAEGSIGSERFETVIIGGGQAGLSVGHHLRERGRPFVILDANERIGDAWRNRWDSLRLFTPAKYDGLAGMRFPARADTFPSKDEMADYLESYAARFDLPVRTGVDVNGLTRQGDLFVVSSGDRHIEADNVVIATGANCDPSAPAFAAQLDRGIVQLHSSAYRDPSQLQEGGVLIVGVGNSGAEIAYEVARTHRSWLSGEPAGQIPVRHGPVAARFVFPLVRFLGHHVLTFGTPIGRKVLPRLASKGAPLIRVKLKHLVAAGVERVPRVVGARNGSPLMEDQHVLEVTNVIWCTGYRQSFSWIAVPGFEDGRTPKHDRGVIPSEPGMYFVGLEFQYAATSDVILGVGRDAEYVATHIARREADRPADAVGNVRQRRS